MTEEKRKTSLTEEEATELRRTLHNFLMLDYYKKNLPPEEFAKYKKTHPMLFIYWTIFNEERKKVRAMFADAKKEALKKYLTR